MHSTRVDKGFLHFNDPVFSDSAHDELARLLGSVPALPDSLLTLEALLEQSTVDLSAVCAVIRADLGLALRVLPLAPVPLDPAFSALQQCILEAGIHCLRMVGQTTPALALSYRNPRLHADLLRLWHHSRLVAESAEQIAVEQGNMDPEKAYVAGLLHDLLALTTMLSQCGPGAPPTKDDEEPLDARKLGMAWKIPPYAIESIETRGVGVRCVGAIAMAVAAAHEQVAEPVTGINDFPISLRSLGHG